MSLIANVRSFLRTQIQRRGFTIVPFPLKKYLDDFGINLVLDVGANIGQYAEDLRGIGYRGRIESFEPMSKAYAVIKAKAARDQNWNVYHFAIGDVETTLDLSISANGPSSSFLPLSQDASNAEIDLRYIETESVTVRRLDSLLPNIRRDTDRMFLKIDTQGFEKHVIDGTGSMLEEFIGVQIELSLTSQYVGELPASKFLDLMSERGFVPYWVLHGYRSRKSMQLKQVDVLFFRDHSS